MAASLCGQSGPSPHYPQSYTSLLLTPGCSGKCLQVEMSDNDVFPLLIQRLIDTMDCMTHEANRECHKKIISYVACCNVVCSTQRGCLQAECCVRCPGVRSPVLHCSTAATNQLIPSQAAGGWTAELAARVREDFTAAAEKAPTRAFSLLNVSILALTSRMSVDSSIVYYRSETQAAMWCLDCLCGRARLAQCPLCRDEVARAEWASGEHRSGSVDNNIIRDICK